MIWRDIPPNQNYNQKKYLIFLIKFYTLTIKLLMYKNTRNSLVKRIKMRYVKNDTIYSIQEIRNLYPNISMNEGNDLSHLGFTELIETQPPQKEGYYVVEDKQVNNTQKWKFVKIEEPIIDVITIRQARELLIELDLFDAIEDAINQIQDPKEKRKLLNYWEYSDSFNLNHPQLLDIAAIIDLTQDQLITLFRNASKL